jgi:hypothetical protein
VQVAGEAAPIIGASTMHAAPCDGGWLFPAGALAPLAVGRLALSRLLRG